MLKDITLGQYYPADSILHKLDPRVKLFGTLIYIISLFTFRGIPAFLLATIFLAAVIQISKVPFSYMVKGLKSIIVLMIITGIFISGFSQVKRVTVAVNSLTDVTIPIIP